MSSKRKQHRPDGPPGIIARDEAYTLDEFRERVGWSDHALRSARRSGLQVIYTNGRGYVLGSDFLKFLRSNGKLEFGKRHGSVGSVESSAE